MNISQTIDILSGKDSLTRNKWIHLTPLMVSTISIISISICHFLALTLGHTQVVINSHLEDSRIVTKILTPNISPTVNRNPQYSLTIINMIMVAITSYYMIPLVVGVLNMYTLPTESREENPTRKSHTYTHSLLESLRNFFHVPCKKLINVCIVCLYLAIFGYCFQSAIPLQLDFLQTRIQRYELGYSSITLTTRLHHFFAAIFFFCGTLHCTIISVFITMETLSHYIKFLRCFGYPNYTLMSPSSKLIKCLTTLLLWFALIMRLSYVFFKNSTNLSDDMIEFRMNVFGIQQRWIVFSMLCFVSTYTLDLKALKDMKIK